ncbi:MAG: cupin domain-containing protein [Kiritimatiellales bacterium]
MKKNLFENIPESAPEEVFTELLLAEGVRIERIVSFGQVSPEGFWYDLPENEWILLLEGSATLAFQDNHPVALRPGDYLRLPAGCLHRVEKTSEIGRTVWLAVFYK